MIDIKINDEALKYIFRQEIPSSVKQLLSLQTKSYVVVQFKFGTNGKVIEVGFHTQPESPISPIIFQRIEDRIKKEIAASYNQYIIKSIGAPAYTTFNFISYSKEIFFNRL